MKIILLGLAFALSLPGADKRPYFVHLSFKFTLQLINGISSDLQKLLKYFNSTAIGAYFRILLELFGAGWTTVFPNNLALYLNDLKLLVFLILFLILVASFFK